MFQHRMGEGPAQGESLLAWSLSSERVTGIEPALSAWEADVLPLNYTRERHHCTRSSVAALSPDPVGESAATLRRRPVRLVPRRARPVTPGRRSGRGSAASRPPARAGGPWPC